MKNGSRRGRTEWEGWNFLLWAKS